MDERDFWQTWDTFGSRLTWLTYCDAQTPSRASALPSRPLTAFRR